MEERERKLRESEERYRSFIEQSPLCIHILSPDGRTLQVNRAWEELWGVTLDDIAGYNLLEDQQLVAKGIMPYVQRGFAGEPTPIPPIMYDPNETIPGLTSREEPKRWVSAFIYPVRDEAGNVREVILMHDDITEHKQAEEVRARLAAIVESSDDAIIGKTLEAIITNWNRGAQRIYGYSAEEVVGKPINILVPPDRPDEIPKIMEKLRRGEAINHYETVRVTKDGRRLDISLTISPIREPSGNIVGASTIARDITESKRAEEALKQSELLYHTLIEQATENIFLVDTETRRIMESNPAFQRTLGYTEEELRTMTLYDIVAAERKSIDRNIRRVQGKDPFIGERKYRRKDGSLVDVEVSASVILRNGRETMCVVAHDVTERKKNEETQRFLAEAGASLSSSLDYRSTLSRMAHLAVPYLADWCAVDILEEDGSLERLAMAHQDPEKIALARELEERYPPDPEAPQGIAQVMRTGQSELVPEIPEQLLEQAVRDDEHREILQGLGLKSYMIVPLVARGRTLGAITLVSAESGRRYGQAELELAEELARRAALAVDNARLYRANIQVARTLQEGLLPSRLPEVPGVEVGLRYLSAGEVDVGGDFYDLFDTKVVQHNGSSSSSWAAVIGDVSGKGAEAAAVLALARYTIRVMAMRESHPSGVLSGLNEAMVRQRREREDYKFCTVAYAKVETNAKGTTSTSSKHGAKVTVCRGGHSPPFVLKADGSIYKIGRPGHAIGVFDEANLTDQEAHLAPGEALVLYTDGVVEARSPEGLFFGEERLMALLRSSAGLDAPTIAGRIEEEVLNFQEQSARDDIAVLVLRVPN